MKWDLTQLYYFKAIAKNEHLTNASKELHITQPALSRSLAKLEQELGVTLFDRQGRNLKLNRYGHILLHHANAITAELIQIPLSIEKEQNQIRSCLNIGSSNSAFTTDWISQFFLENPNISVHHRIFSETDIYTGLLENDIHFAITMFPPKQKDICSFYLMQDKFQLLVSHNHPLAKKKQIYFSEAAAYDFIALPQSDFLYRFIDYLSACSGVMPHIIFEGSNEFISSIITTTKACLVILKSPSTAAQYIDELHHFAHVIDLQDSFATFDIIVSWQAFQEKNDVAMRFIDFLKKMKKQEISDRL